MRINVILGHAFPVPAVLGGAIEKVCWELGNQWARMGHDVVLYSRTWPEFPNEETLPSGMKVIRLKGYPWQSRRWRNLINALRYAFSLRSRVRSADVHLCNTLFFPFLADRSRTLRGQIYVAIQREPKMHFRVYRLFLRICPKSRLRFVAVSEFIMRRVLEMCPSMHGRIAVSPNAVDTSYYNIGETRWATPTVLFAGRLVREKGIEEVVGAFSEVRKKWPDAFLRIVGPLSANQGTDAQFLDELRMRIESLDVVNRTILTGFKEGESLLQEYQKAWVFCYPSFRGEAFPCGPLEAMACGTPVLTTDWGPFPEQFTDGHEGFQVPVRRVDLLRQRMEQLLENDELRYRMGQAARARAEEFSLARVANRYVQVFELFGRTD